MKTIERTYFNSINEINEVEKQPCLKQITYYDGRHISKVDGPAIIIFNRDGTIAGEEYWYNDRYYLLKEDFIKAIKCSSIS